MNECKTFQRRAKAAGWSIGCTAKHHLRLTHPGAPRTIIICPSTTGDRRTYRNAEALMRRALANPKRTSP